jgi:hypothetical protein
VCYFRYHVHGASGTFLLQPVIAQDQRAQLRAG